jgi:hypothetical protein
MQISQPVTAGSTTIQLTTQVFRLNLPFLRNGGLIYHRPVSVVVRPGTADERVVPVIDITRLVQIGLIVTALFTLLVSGASLRSRRP